MAEKRKKKAGAGTSRARERERLLEQAAAVELPACADVAVLGGGAAGLACAIAAAEAGARVVVLERDLECGRTILATGNGRCNFANADLSAEHYKQPEFVEAVMGEGEAALAGIQEFFAACGLAWAEEDGRLYPRSRQAASVRNVLLARAERAGVTFACGREVIGAERMEAAASRSGVEEAGFGANTEADGEPGFACAAKAADASDAVNNGEVNDGVPSGTGVSGPSATSVQAANKSQVDSAADSHFSWNISFTEVWSGETSTLEASALVFAGGGSAHALAGELGLPLVADEPVLCALSAQGPVPGMLEALDGRRAHCVASLTRGGRVIIREAGEALFRPYGLSGIVSFDLSRHARPGDMLELDLAPEVDAWEVDKLVASRPGDAHALDGILDPQIAAELIKLAGGVNFGGLAWRVAPLVKGLPLRVTGKADEARAQVTRGGIDVVAVTADDLAVIDQPGLFACGEALDVDGACGGFNLAWAWLSGLRAGASAALLAIEIRERLAAEEAERAAMAEKAAMAKKRTLAPRESMGEKAVGKPATDEVGMQDALPVSSDTSVDDGAPASASSKMPASADASAATNRAAKKGNAC